MVRRSNLAAASVAALALAWLAVGCAPKSEDTKVAASDSTVKAAAPAPADTTKPAAGDPAKLGTLPVKPAKAPDHVEVQHVLIGFQGTIPGKTVTRTKDEAEKLAAEVLDKARKGENFDTLVQSYTDDQFPGVYDLANDGVTPDKAKQEFPRGGMVSGFSDVAFGISPGNVDVAAYQPDKTKPHYSPFGWHIIKRLQ